MKFLSVYKYNHSFHILIMEEAITHYQELEEEYQLQDFNANISSDDDDDDDLNELPKPLCITAEEIIRSKDDDTMRLLTNFTIQEFKELYNIVSSVITKGIHKDTLISAKTRFLMTLCYCKYNEKWKILGFYFGLNYSYAQKIVINVITKTQKPLCSEFIKWISVINRISDFNMYIEDWPTLLGSLDATVQIIKRPSNAQVQKAFYSGKHKFCCYKTQALVSPTGFLIHCSQPVEGSIHDFKLFEMSKLEELIFKENENCQRLLANNCVTLADAGYQGLSKKIPGAVTPFKRSQSGLTADQIDYNKKISKSRIIVENWFGRHKSLWAVMGTKFRLELSSYEPFWLFCASLTNYHIKIHPLRNPEPEEIEENENQNKSDEEFTTVTDTESDS